MAFVELEQTFPSNEHDEDRTVYVNSALVAYVASSNEYGTSKTLLCLIEGGSSDIIYVKEPIEQVVTALR